MRTNRLLAAALLLLPVALSSRTMEETWVVNLKDSPTTLTGQPNGYFTIVNRTQKEMVSFTLACVKTNDNGFVAEYQWPPEKRLLKPGSSVSRGIMDAPYTDEYDECVRRRNAKMTVVHVDFADGRSWHPRCVRVPEPEKKGPQ